METSVAAPCRQPGRAPGPRLLRGGLTVFVALGVLTGLLLRFVHFSAPPYDAHAFRQTQTLSTVEFFYSEGIDLLHPKTLYMGYPGILVLELPVVQAFAALLFHLVGPHLEVVRVLSILFGAGTAWVLFCTVDLLLDRRTAVLAALIYWLAPSNIGYQRSMLIDPAAVFFALLSFYSLTRLIYVSGLGAVGGNQNRYWRDFALFSVATWMAAMIKALYLWPCVLLLADAVLRRKARLDLRSVRILAVWTVAGGSFLAWNLYATHVNDASPFTRGIKPTGLLGLSPLLNPQFYLTMIVRRPKWWLGLLGALLYPVGLWAGWKQRHDPEQATRLLLLWLIPPTYLAAFSFINLPHDYYQLIITPFLAIIAAYGLNWLAARPETSGQAPASTGNALFSALCGALLVMAPFTYIFWYHGGRPDARTLRFEQLCEGKTHPGSSGMVFVANEEADAPPNSDLPEFLYAAHLWGIGKVVPNGAEARQCFEKWFPDFPKLDYVVLYGIEYPAWLAAKDFRLAAKNADQRLYIFERVPHA